MHTFGVRPASKPEIKDITAWFIQERSKDARFVHLSRSAWQRFLMRNWVLPRYLRSQAHTFVLEQDARRAGFAVVEQMGDFVTLTEFSVDDGFDEAGLLLALTRTAEEMARDREYRYARIAPLDSSEPRLALFRSAGYELVDYYLWSFTGELAGSELAGEAALRALNPKEGLEQRVEFLRQELDASEVATRAMIEVQPVPAASLNLPLLQHRAGRRWRRCQPDHRLSLLAPQRAPGRRAIRRHLVAAGLLGYALGGAGDRWRCLPARQRPTDAAAGHDQHHRPRRPLRGQLRQPGPDAGHGRAADPL